MTPLRKRSACRRRDGRCGSRHRRNRADVIDVKSGFDDAARSGQDGDQARCRLWVEPVGHRRTDDAPESPVAWTMFAALRRQTEEDAGTEQKLVSVADRVVSTMSVVDAASR